MVSRNSRDFRTEFGRMSMPSILQGGFSSQMHIAQQLVSR